MLRIILISIILMHGLLHLIGFYRSLSRNGVIYLRDYIPKSLGLLWLICALLFLLTGFFIIFRVRGWIYFMIAALIISQALIFLTWKESKYGSLINISILILGFLYLD